MFKAAAEVHAQMCTLTCPLAQTRHQAGPPLPLPKRRAAAKRRKRSMRPCVYTPAEPRASPRLREHRQVLLQPLALHLGPQGYRTFIRTRFICVGGGFLGGETTIGASNVGETAFCVCLDNYISNCAMVFHQESSHYHSKSDVYYNIDDFGYHSS